MKIEYDREVDALYVRIQEKFVAKTVEVDEGAFSLFAAAAVKCPSNSPGREACKKLWMDDDFRSLCL